MSRRIIPHTPRANFAAVVLSMGEIVFDETNKIFYVGDGITAGGNPLNVSGAPTLTQFGPTSTTMTAMATVTAALAAVGRGGALYVDKEVNIGANPADNPGGVDFTGQKKIFSQPVATGSLGYTGGSKVFNRIGRDQSLMSWGVEALGPVFLKKLAAGSAVKIALIGDSNTEGYSGPELVALLQTLPNATVQNFAHSGTTFEQWRTNTGGINGTGHDLAGVMATGPDLLVDLYGGTNDAYFGGTPTSFEASKRAGYNTIRASRTQQQLSIAMVTAGPMNDGGPQGVEAGTKRDELFNAQVRPIIMDLADDYGCAFVDKNARVPDSFFDFIAAGGQNTNLDANRVHSQDWMSKALAQWVFEALVPTALRPSGYRAMMFGDLNTGTTSQIGLNTYPRGISISRATGGTPAWPFDGYVLTVMPSSAAGSFGIQLNWQYLSGIPMFAMRQNGSNPNTWGSWTYIGIGDPVDMIPATGFTKAEGAGSSGGENMHTRTNSGAAIAQGYVNMTTPALLTAGQAIAQVAIARDYPALQQWWVNLLLFNGTAWERIRGIVTATGAVTAGAASTLLPVRVYIEATWNRVNGQ